jgi:tRNA threonylcarbamoyladenosine biosynthesis protein TsaB
MLILSLDTSTRAGSAAVLKDGAVLREVAGDGSSTHGERLPRDLIGLVEAAGVRIQDIELFAVAAGPGSFTGLRVGIATIQGLAMARGRKVTPVSTLEALARAPEPTGSRTAAWMDAQRGEVFASLFAPGGREVLIPPTSARPEATLAAWRAIAELGDVVFVGDGAVRYHDAIASTLPDARIEAPPLLAAIVGRIAAEDPVRAVLPHAVVPVYVRRSDAEIARDRKLVKG